MTSIVIVEDSTQLSYAVAGQLEAWHGFKVTCVKDPIELVEVLQRKQFDVALVDLLFEHLNGEFDERRRAGRVRLTDPTLLITGLTALTTLRKMAPATRTVVWTAGEANRRLHILYAYEQLGQRVFCSKSSGAERAEAVAAAINAALDDAEYIDPNLNAYLPRPHAPTLAETLLRLESHRAIWRHVALGIHTRADLARLTGFARRYIGNQIPGLYTNLRTLDVGLPETTQPHAEIIRYATANWQFFLDDAVRQAFP